MSKISDLIKVTFRDNVTKEDVDIIELQDLKRELQKLISEKGLKDKWIKEFFELK